MQLATLKKGTMSTATYFNKMRSIRDELAVVGKVVDEDEMVTFIFNGLDFDYNPFVSSILGRSDAVTISNLYYQMTAYDMRYEMYEEQQGGGQFQSSANSAGRGRGNFHGRGGNRGGRGRGCNGPPRHSNTNTNNNSSFGTPNKGGHNTKQRRT